MTRREELFPEIRRLREDEGLTFREIAARVGLSRSFASEIYDDPTGEKVRARKALNDGECVDCGTVTRSGGAKVPPERCVPCANAARRARSRQWILDSFTEWNERFGAPPSSVDWNRPGALASVYCAWKVDRYERTGRVWPSSTLVQESFGSWNNGLRAAGFEPLTPSEHWLGHQGRALRDEDERAA